VGTIHVWRESLYHVPQDLTLLPPYPGLRLENVKTGGSRGLPIAMFLPSASIRCVNRAIKRWDVPGSGLFSSVSARHAIEQISSGSTHAVKRLQDLLKRTLKYR
jgi:hypothetical protein